MAQGFFDENEENAVKILKAVMEKRKRESGPVRLDNPLYAQPLDYNME